MESEAESIPHIIKIDSPNAGPSAAIIACTHGNEPIGLSAISYLLSYIKITRGTLYFILGNPKAAQCYLDAECSISKEKSRYVDQNLNRLPPKEALNSNQDIYENRRASELLPILEQIDGVLDLHSTSSDAPAMLICVDEASRRVVQDSLFPFNHVITDINAHIRGKFLIEYCTQARLRLLAECGQHECHDASERAVNISLTFLHRLGLIEDLSPPQANKDISYYHAQKAIFLPQNCGEFRLKRLIEPFEWIEKNQILACNGKDVEFTSPSSGYAIMAPETQNALDCSEALLFLCDKNES